MQEHENLPREQSLLEFLSERTSAKEHEIFARLVQSGFDRDQVRESISTLSPGGRARLTLVYFSFREVNTLILDEPTNHLDFEAMEALEEVLGSYTGTVIVVSHDRYFLERTALTDIYQIIDDTLNRIPDLKEFIRSAERRARKLLQQL
jgi:ATPase subunit of ABC transporter with duplicated ATPase domains